VAGSAVCAVGPGSATTTAAVSAVFSVSLGVAATGAASSRVVAAVGSFDDNDEITSQATTAPVVSSPAAAPPTIRISLSGIAGSCDDVAFALAGGFEPSGASAARNSPGTSAARCQSPSSPSRTRVDGLSRPDLASEISCDFG
jgi:hypothetical protein